MIGMQNMISGNGVRSALERNRLVVVLVKELLVVHTGPGGKMVVLMEEVCATGKQVHTWYGDGF
jgi:hypothetical protein